MTTIFCCSVKETSSNEGKEKNYSMWLLWEEEKFPLISHLHTDPSLSLGPATKLKNEYGTRVCRTKSLSQDMVDPLLFIFPHISYEVNWQIVKLSDIFLQGKLFWLGLDFEIFLSLTWDCLKNCFHKSYIVSVVW